VGIVSEVVDAVVLCVPYVWYCVGDGCRLLRSYQRYGRCGPSATAAAVGITPLLVTACQPVVHRAEDSSINKGGRMLRLAIDAVSILRFILMLCLFRGRIEY
jgi:hypothetical protein